MKVFISAAASGLGLSIAKLFLENNHQVHICDNDLSNLDKVSNYHSNLSMSLTDTSKPEQVEKLFHDIDENLGGLDVLVNNVGIAGPTARVEDIDYDDWRTTLEIDLDSYFLCSKYAIPRLKQNSTASIINISSTAGWMGYPLRAPYCAAKWAVIGLSKTMAIELGEFNIRVNTVCPGSLDGERMDAVIDKEAAAKGIDPTLVRERYKSQVSLNTFIDPLDIAQSVYFLASDAAKRISGQTISVDGNMESLTA